jgi:hypothetical protein
MTASSEAAPARSRSRARLPDFFIVGHHKSGTTALYEMLRRHPQIFMPTLKEPRFFDTDLHSPSRTRSNSGCPDSYEEYLALFEQAAPGQRLGEASPSYLRSAVAAAAIARVQPQARCIAILREPASFVRSMHSQLVQEHVEHEKDLRRAVERERLTRDGRTWLRYSDHVRYVEQLRRFYDAFPAEQLLVLIYDDFRADNDATVRRVLRFLDVDPHVDIDPLEANPTVRVRSLRADRAVSSLYGGGRNPASRALKRTVKALTPRGVRGAVLSTVRRRLVYGRPRPEDDALMRDLRRRYAGEVRATGDLLGRDLVTLWGYDRLE